MSRTPVATQKWCYWFCHFNIQTWSTVTYQSVVTHLWTHWIIRIIHIEGQPVKTAQSRPCQGLLWHPKMMLLILPFQHSINVHCHLSECYDTSLNPLDHQNHLHSRTTSQNSTVKTMSKIPVVPENGVIDFASSTFKQGQLSLLRVLWHIFEPIGSSESSTFKDNQSKQHSQDRVQDPMLYLKMVLLTLPG